ncbi:InlB B-repeat-containing protein, partial [uncultured Adlercreutzia sp.]|uniref:InlB B-repeat-containing protein n=1 Tax=uncultured Adlercreutzia sp. TaxID=875803 RepID=UPI00272E2E82
QVTFRVKSAGSSFSDTWFENEQQKVDNTPATHTPVTGKAKRLNASGEVASAGEVSWLSTFEISVPDVYVLPIQTDTSWCIDVSCTTIPHGLLKTTKVWETNASTTLYRSIGAALLAIDFAPGFSGAEDAYTREFEEGEQYTLALNAFTRNGYAFRNWTAVFKRGMIRQQVEDAGGMRDETDQEMAARYWYIPGGGDAEGDKVYLREDQVRPNQPIYFTNGSTLSPALASSLFTGTVNEQTGQVDHAVFTASWELNTYTVTLSMPDKAVGDRTVKYNTEQTPKAIPSPSWAGHAFIGWSPASAVESDGNGGWRLPKGAFNDVTLTAQWETVTYSISYDLAGGRWGASGQGTQAYDTTMEVPLPTPERDGYEFAGWVGTGTPGFGMPGANPLPQKPWTIQPDTIVGDAQFTAVWTAKSYAITYDLAGGAWAEADVDKVLYSYQPDFANYELPTPVREGYEFAGWTGSNGSVPDASKPTVLTSGSFGAKSYKANWAANGYTISW